MKQKGWTILKYRMLVVQFALTGLTLLLQWPGADGQTPFICRGQSFITYRDGIHNALADLKIRANQSTGQVNLDYLGNLKTLMNSVGYRSTDNLIYGFDPQSMSLYRIDAEMKVTRLKYFPTWQMANSYGGDVTPDGRYFVMVAGDPFYGTYGWDRYYFIIDLTDESYPIVKQSTITDNNTRIFDLAFDPVSGDLYAFDSKNNRLVILNKETGLLEKTFMPVKSNCTLGALFFDVYGNLRGYGTNKGNLSDQAQLFEINKATGQITEIAEGPVTTSTDGCSCPYTVDLLLSAETGEICRTVDLTLQLTHSGLDSVIGMNLELTLPKGFVITHIDNRIHGEVASDLNTNLLHIKNIKINKGSMKTTLRVKVPNTTAEYKIQANLTELPYYLGSSMVSDNPDTYWDDDSTELNITQSLKNKTEEVITICKGEFVELSAYKYNVLHEWESGTRDTVIKVDKEGTYTARYADRCDSSVLYYHVRISTVDVSIVPVDPIVKPFEIVRVYANVKHPNSNKLTYQWVSAGDKIPCTSCQGPFDLIITEPDTISVTVTNEYGCNGNDKIYIRIDLGFPDLFFIPNAFSPNSDGLNDTFYISGFGFLIERFQLYDQWGKIQFEIVDKPSGFSRYGWPGNDRGANGNHPNVYYYLGTMRNLKGNRFQVSGTVTLVR